MEPLSEDIIGRYYDGELSPGQRAHVEKALMASADARRELSANARMSEAFRILGEDSLDGVSFDGFDKRVMNLVQSRVERPGAVERLRVYLKEFFDYRKVVWIPAVSVVGAASAALLAIGLAGHPSVPTMPGAKAPETWQASAGELISEARIANSDEVRGTQYRILTDNGRSIAVVWIDD